MSRNWKLIIATSIVGAGMSVLGGCVAYPIGTPDVYNYQYYGAPAYSTYAAPPAYVTGSFYYYDGPRRYWGPRHYYAGPRGSHEYRGRDFSRHRGHRNWR